MRLDVWLTCQWAKQARAVLISARFHPWKRGLGKVRVALSAHLRRSKLGLLACAELHPNRTGHSNRMVGVDVSACPLNRADYSGVDRSAGSNWLHSIAN